MTSVGLSGGCSNIRATTAAKVSYDANILLLIVTVLPKQISLLKET